MRELPVTGGVFSPQRTFVSGIVGISGGCDLEYKICFGIRIGIMKVQVILMLHSLRPGTFFKSVS